MDIKKIDIVDNKGATIITINNYIMDSCALIGR